MHGQPNVKISEPIFARIYIKECKKKVSYRKILNSDKKSLKIERKLKLIVKQILCIKLVKW